MRSRRGAPHPMRSTPGGLGALVPVSPSQVDERRFPNTSCRGCWTDTDSRTGCWCPQPRRGPCGYPTSSRSVHLSTATALLCSRCDRVLVGHLRQLPSIVERAGGASAAGARGRQNRGCPVSGLRGDPNLRRGGPGRAIGERGTDPNAVLHTVQRARPYRGSGGKSTSARKRSAQGTPNILARSPRPLSSVRWAVA